MTVTSSVLLVALLSSSGEDVVARVDQIAITRGALVRRAEALGRKAGSAEQVLGQILGEALLAGEARRLGLEGSPEVAAEIERGVRRAASRAFVDSFGTRANVDDATLRELFHATADFIRYDFLSFGSREEAAAALVRIQKGASLAAEAKNAVVARLVKDPSGATPMMRGQLPPSTAAVLFGAEPGRFVGPVEDDAAWSIVRVLDREIGSEAEFAERREALLRSAHKEAAAAAREHLVEQLRAKAAIQVDEAFLRGLQGAQASPEQLQHVIATVNGAPVRYADIYDRIRALGGQSAHMASAGVKLQLARERADERLLEEVALQRGFDKAPEVTVQRPEFERAALAAACAARIRAGAGAPSEREIEDQYRKNAAVYARPFAQVLPRVAADAAERKRTAAVDSLVAELRKKATVSIDGNALGSGTGARP